ncbi:MAG: NADH-quinone oxidoreductase subunit L [Candidatus Saccharibacteria bacterium]
MEAILTLIAIIPLAGFLILALSGGRMPERVVSLIGTGSVGLSAVLTLVLGVMFLSSPDQQPLVVTLWQWLSTAGLTVNIAFHLDVLSLVFIFVVTVVGFLIHLYSGEFMSGDEGYSRFFAYMNLFVFSMLVLVLADNLLLLYLGWEGVGLCSYLLIGFWYKEAENGYAARKAFIVTRVGDVAMMIGLFLLFIHLGSLNIQELMQRASSDWQVGSALPVWAAALLLGGALGKSAQLPLQTWLPDAMAGPSPVSALIHAATMVTAGVYLIARTHVLFTLAPVVLSAVAIIGALTLLLAGFSALAQHDLKRVLAYSTISQIGYMFLALGVGAWSAAIFHFMIHAFFKALLFLAGGAVILSLQEEHDIFKMGGLRHRLPLVYWTFLAGAASLSALPLITAGFYSKDAILWYAFSSEKGGLWLGLAAVAGAFLTSLYTFRLVFLTFFGDVKTEPGRVTGKRIAVPLVVLAILSLIAGFIELPQSMGNVHLVSALLGKALPGPALSAENISELLFQLLTSVISLSGIYLAYRLYYRKSTVAESFERSSIHQFFYKGWGFDKLYDLLLVRPFVWLSEIDKNDFIDLFNRAIGRIAFTLNDLLSITQNGKIRWYVMALAIGIVFIFTLINYL